MGGWGGWDDNVPWTCTHSSLGMWWDGVGRVRWGDGMMNVPCGGMGGVGGIRLRW